ncbi:MULTISPECIES: SCO4402 family protein [unclassified Rhodanobacter]|uniref:CdiI immunity protein domain-containing protein n=1 Tax=Rhodanobacter humi TaxID=1888173 RepID=A0ABV4ANL6_9GAMM
MANRIEHGDMDITAPRKRLEMISLLDELSDKSKQDHLWLMHEDYPSSSGIDDVFHFFFDDTDLNKDVDSEIGRILKDQVEAVVISNVCNALDQLFQKLGDADSSVYMSDPAWLSLMHLAQAALIVLRDSE